MSLMAVVTMPCDWQGGHCAGHELGELDRLALRARHGSIDPAATTPLLKGVRDNNDNKN